MYRELNTLGVENFNYFSLVRKSDNKEVYTSPDYHIEESENVFNFPKIKKTLMYYFERVNGAIEQQRNSPKASDEQKNAPLLNITDYKIEYKKFMPMGYAPNVYWTKEADEFLREII